MLARQIAIGFGIAIIYPLLIFYGVATFHPAPKFQAFVTATNFVPSSTANPEQRKEFEAKRREQQKAFEAAAKEFARAHVFVAAPLGVAAILIGAYLTLHAIGTGLIFGGIFADGWGYYGYWQYLDDWIRFVSLLVGFVVLLFVGYHRMAGQPRS